MRYRSVIGIDVTEAEIRGACARYIGGTLHITGIASEPLPAGCMNADGMLNAHSAADTLRKITNRLDPKASHIVIGMTDCSLVARVMEIPPVPAPEIRAVLRGEMDHYRILPAGQSAFDFFPLPEQSESGAEAGDDKLARVLLMGAEERLVSTYRTLAETTNMNLIAVEPGSIAVVRALYPMLLSEDAVATIILTKGGADIFITHQGNLGFYRHIDTGIPELRNRTVGHETTASESSRRGVMLVAPDPETTEPAPQVEAVSDPYNHQAINLLATEVQRSIDYYVREYPEVTDKMIARFSIDAPDAQALYDIIANQIRSESDIALPSVSVALSADAAAILQNEPSGRYTVAIGLALRADDGDFAKSPALNLCLGDSTVAERPLAPRTLALCGVATGIILLASITAFIVLNMRIASAESTLKQAKVELSAVSQEHAAKVAALERQKNLVSAIQQRDRPFREALDFISAAVSARACLTMIAVDSEGVINISGEARDARVVADIMDTISLSPALESIRLNGISQVDTHGDGQAVRFDLQTGFPKPEIAVASAGDQATAKPQGGN